MTTRDIYEHGFDEDDGRTINAISCPECEGRLRTDGGETACEECGLIVNEYRFDHSATAHDLDADEATSEHTGRALTPTRHDRGLSTEIGYYRDGLGNQLSAEKRRRLERLRTQHTRAKWQSRQEQNLAHACGEIARLVAALDLTFSVREEASQLYRQAQDADLIRGRSIEMIASGCVYVACRHRGQTRTVGEIAEIATCPEREIWLGYRILSRELDLAIDLLRPLDLLPKFASACDVPRRIEHRAFDLAERAETEGIGNGRSPSGVAAACLYVAAREASFPLTQHQIGEIAGTSDVTIRARWEELEAMEN